LERFLAGSVSQAGAASQPDQWELVSITVTPKTVSLPAGSTVQFSAEGMYAGGDPQDETDAVEWTASKGDMLSFDPQKNGRVYLLHQTGSVDIIATDKNTGKFGKATIKVTKALESRMSEKDRKASETKPEPKPKSKDPYKDDNEKAYKYGYKDGLEGNAFRDKAILKQYFKDSLDTAVSGGGGLLERYGYGYKDGQNARVENAVGNGVAKGKYLAGWGLEAYQKGFSDGKEGKPSARAEYTKPMPGWESLDMDAVAKAYDLGFNDGQKTFPHDAKKAYEIGTEDGRHDDPFHRQGVGSLGKADLLTAYDNGFAEAKGASDRVLDDAGVGIDSTPTPNQPQNPGVMSKYDWIMTALGITSTGISVLEAGGSVAAAGFGTTLGVLLLPIIGFKIGTDIAEAHDKKEQAIRDFINKFIAYASYDAMERGRALVKSIGASALDLNDEGVDKVVELFGRYKVVMTTRIKKELDDSPTREKFEALYKGWVDEMSKGFARILSNKRLAK
jgi:hypothetical protein